MLTKSYFRIINILLTALLEKRVIFLYILTLHFYVSYLSAGSSNATKEIIIKNHVGTKNGQVGFKVLEDGSRWVGLSALAIDAKGNIYIADNINNRIQKFDKKGRFLSKINIHIEKKSWQQIIDDLSVDNADNLYVASRHEGKIDKYSPERKLLQSINLDDKDIYWDEKKGWVRGAVQIERITVDATGNIYLQGVHELIKFMPDGKIERKWPLGDYIGTLVLDEKGNLYMIEDGKTVKKYDINGNLAAQVKCGELYSWLEKGKCLIPYYIDKNGFLYWFEKNGTVVVKADKQRKRVAEYNIGPFFIYKNTSKFDGNGNFYILDNSETKFWIEKIVFK
jgi:hypothetical protein